MRKYRLPILERPRACENPVWHTSRSQNPVKNSGQERRAILYKSRLRAIDGQEYRNGSEIQSSKTLQVLHRGLLPPMSPFNEDVEEFYTVLCRWHDARTGSTSQMSLISEKANQLKGRNALGQILKVTYMQVRIRTIYASL